MNNLTEFDYQTFEACFIDRQLVEQAKLRRVDDFDGAELVGKTRKAGTDYGGIIFPYFLPEQAKAREYRLRRDKPDLEQKADGSIKEKAKYLSPTGARNMLYFPPNVKAEWLKDVSILVCLTEGEKKTLALHRLALHGASVPRFLALGLSGVWNFRGTVGKTINANGARQDVKGLIADFQLIEWKNRQVTIVFDANVQTNENVKIARNSLAKTLRELGAKVVCVDLPKETGINGIDDLLGHWERADGTETAVTKGLELLENISSDDENVETRIKPFPVPNERCFYGLAGDSVACTCKGAEKGLVCYHAVSALSLHIGLARQRQTA